MQSIGQVLQETREKKGITPQQAARDSKIKLDYIEKLEANEFDRLIAPAYAKSFLRMYAEYLGLDAKPLLEQYVAEHAPSTTAPVAKSKPTSEFKSGYKTHSFEFPFSLRIVVASIIVALLVLISLIVILRSRKNHTPTPPIPPATQQSTPSSANPKLSAKELVKVHPNRAADTLKIPQTRQTPRP